MILRIISLLLTVITLFVMAAPAAAFIIAVIETTEAEPQNEEEIILTAEGPDYTVKVACGPEAEIPADAVLSVREIEDWKVGEEEIPSRHELAFSRAFDISILNAEGEKIQPKSDVRVSIDLPEANDAETIQVLHYADEEEPLSVEEELSPEEEELPVEKGAESLRGLKRGIDTSDLQFGKQSLRGESAGLLGVSPDEPENSDGVVVTHSDGEELPAEEKERHTDEEAEQTVEEPAVGEPLDATVEDGIVSFSTGSFSIFAVIGLRTLEKQIVASDGRTYDITVSFGPEAGIPDGASLEVSEILSGEDGNYDSYLARTLDVLGAEEVDYARFFDIRIVVDGEAVQPADGSTVSVEISLADAESDDLSVLHFGDEVEIVAAMVDDGTVSFEASGFSVYAIVDAPEPAGVRYVADLDELQNNSLEGIYLACGKPSKFWESSVNKNNAFTEANSYTSAAEWYFELVDSYNNLYKIYTVTDEVKQYIRNKSGNLVELTQNSAAATTFEISEADYGQFYIKIRGEDKWLQHSNGGNGIRFWTANTDAANAKISFSYADSYNKTIERDPYELDQRTFGIAYHNNSATSAALMIDDANQLVASDMLMRPDVLDNKGVLLVLENEDIQKWKFVCVEADKYYITTEINGSIKYLTITDGVVTLENAPSDNAIITVTPGTGSYSDKWQFTVNGYSLNLQSGTNGDSFNASTGQSATTWMSLVKDAPIGDDDFNLYTARKVSVSEMYTRLDEDDNPVLDDEGNEIKDYYMPDGAEVIIYTRVWNDKTKRYDFYVVDHDGSLALCYDTGDGIEWIGGSINKAVWKFTELKDNDGNPNYYYSFENVQYDNYLVPQLSKDQIIYPTQEQLDDEEFVFNPFSSTVNLPGRRYGEPYTTIIAWDNDEYSYSSYKVENGKIVPCALSEGYDFYFAIIDTPNQSADGLSTVRTVNNDEYGITMKMIDFNNQIKNSSGGVATVSNYGRDEGQTEFFGYDSNDAGLLSAWIDESTGYPTGPKTDDDGNPQSLSTLFQESELTTANQLFLESIHSESGYFEYDSTQNFAHYDSISGVFTVYDQIGAIKGQNESRNTRTHGQFMPYDTISSEKGYAIDSSGNVITNQTDVLSQELPDTDPRKGENLYLIGDNKKDPDDGGVDYFFGMEMEASFTQTPNGLDAWGHDIIFEFSGDDDFWLYVDNQLVLDLGGVHSASTGSINFRTGQVHMYVRDGNGNKVVARSYDTTLREIFRKNYIEKEPKGTEESDADFQTRINNYLDEIFVLNNEGNYVFNEYTTHDMKMFYMERGAGASNLHMRFNLAAVQPGHFILSKELSGTEVEDNSMLEFAYQIWYTSKTDNESEWHLLGTERITNNNGENTVGEDYKAEDHVHYVGNTTKVKYAESFTPAGGTESYSHVFFLKPGQSADVELPDDVAKYYVVECGVNPVIYDYVKINGIKAETDLTDLFADLTDSEKLNIAHRRQGYRETNNDIGASTFRRDYKSSADTTDNRPRVDFNNHVSDGAMKTLSITKKLYDEEGNVLPYGSGEGKDKTEFSFRLYLGDENTTDENLPQANMYVYYVKDLDGNYCRWDSSLKEFVAINVNGPITDYETLSTYLETLTSAQKDAIVFKTSQNGSISRIPTDHTVEVRQLIIGSKWRVEEWDSEVPRGYTRRYADGYVRTDLGGTGYVKTIDGTLVAHENANGAEALPMSGTIGNNNDPPRAEATIEDPSQEGQTNTDPVVEIRNQRGWGLTVQKVWSDADFMERHDDIFFAVYRSGVLLKDTVRRLSSGSTEIYYYFPDLKGESNEPYHFSDYVVKEVTVKPTGENSLIIDDEGIVTVDENVSVVAIEEDHTLTIGGKPVGGEAQSEINYTVHYTTGTITSESGNIRVDTVTNSRPGLKIYKTKWNYEDSLAGADFTLKDQNGNNVAADIYTSREEDGLVTIAYLNEGTYYLTEVRTPKGYIALKNPIQISVNADGQISLSEDSDLFTLIDSTETEMAILKVRNRSAELKVIKVDAVKKQPIEGVHFALYRQVTNNQGNLRKDYYPISGYEDLITDENGLLNSISMNLNAGTYYLTENTPATGYKLIADDICFTIGVDGTVNIHSEGHEGWLTTETDNSLGRHSFIITIPNEIQPIRIKKVIVSTDIPLGDAQFSLYKAVINENDEWQKGESIFSDRRSGNDGYLELGNLTYGKYLLFETKAPDGYNLLTDPIKIEIDNSNGIQVTAWQGMQPADVSNTDGYWQIRVWNNPGVVIPSTGSPGTLTLSLIGTSLTLLAAAGYVLANLPRRKEDSASRERE